MKNLIKSTGIILVLFLGFTSSCILDDECEDVLGATFTMKITKEDRKDLEKFELRDDYHSQFYLELKNLCESSLVNIEISMVVAREGDHRGFQMIIPTVENGPSETIYNKSSKRSGTRLLRSYSSAFIPQSAETTIKFIISSTDYLGVNLNLIESLKVNVDYFIKAGTRP
jgi:hypothetical protein